MSILKTSPETFSFTTNLISNNLLLPAPVNAFVKVALKGNCIEVGTVLSILYW